MRRKWKALSGALTILGFLVALFSVPAAGQRRPSDALILARIFVHEAGWDTSTGDMEAIYAVLAGGATRTRSSFRSYAYAYSGRALRGETERPWVSQLDIVGSTPSAWPDTFTRCRGSGEDRYCETGGHPAWSNFRDRWLAVLAHAERVVGGVFTHSCSVDPHDWGGRMDRQRARRLRLIRISCGDTHNDFYLRPSLVPEEDAGIPAAPTVDAGPDVLLVTRE